MSERVERIYNNFLKDVPKDIQPFIKSLVVSRIAAHQEKPYDPKVGKTWIKNSEFLEQELQNENKLEVLDRAVFLTTLSVHENKNVEWYYRWLRGNGLTLLQDERMRGALNGFIDNTEKSKQFVESLFSILSTNVSSLSKARMSEVPESYSLFVAFLVCESLEHGKATDTRLALVNKAGRRLMEMEVNRVMDYFGEISDTKSLFGRFDAYRNKERYYRAG